MARVGKREWVNAYLAGLEQSAYTGRVQITLEFNKGGISKVTPLREEITEP
jgi:hypothetical protein